MAGGNPHYQERVNRVLDHIGQHLDGDLSLTHLAGIGCFSPFHFHRIFQAVTGETLNTHVRRVRLERAALLMKTSPRKRITEVAIEAGFAGASEFSRAFKSHFGKAPSAWDRRTPLENSKICKAPEGLSYYSLEELENWGANVEVHVTRFGGFRYVYNRIFAPYGNSKLVDAYQALIQWLADRGTSYQDVTFIGMSLDDPSVTPSENCRYDMGVAFPPGTALPDSPSGLTIRDLQPQDVASIHCVGDLGQVDRAWHYLYRVWLPSVAYEPADLPAMEVFVRLPEEIGWETFDLKAVIPVARL